MADIAGTSFHSRADELPRLSRNDFPGRPGVGWRSTSVACARAASNHCSQIGNRPSYETLERMMRRGVCNVLL